MGLFLSSHRAVDNCPMTCGSEPSGNRVLTGFSIPAPPQIQFLNFTAISDNSENFSIHFTILVILA